jgi:hypothetical protein
VLSDRLTRSPPAARTRPARTRPAANVRPAGCDRDLPAGPSRRGRRVGTSEPWPDRARRCSAAVARLREPRDLQPDRRQHEP